MKTVNASHFKAHFGSVLDEAEKKPVRIARRGRPAAVLVSEDDYQSLSDEKRELGAEKKAALERLNDWVENGPEITFDQKQREDDPRLDAILTKYERSNS